MRRSRVAWVVISGRKSGGSVWGKLGNEHDFPGGSGLHDGGVGGGAGGEGERLADDGSESAGGEPGGE